jgi:hypothetical protein
MSEWYSYCTNEELAEALTATEAKLAKAMEALKNIAHGGGYTDMQIARAALAELEGK